MLFTASSVLLSMLTAAYGQETPEEREVLQQVREADQGLIRVYLNETDWYFALRDDIETPEFAWRGAMLWRYDGQAVYSDESVPYPSVISFTEPDFVLTGAAFDADAYFGVGVAHRTDNYGRRWVLDYVDADLAQSVHDENDAANALSMGEEPGVEANLGIEYNPDAGAERLVTLRSWSTVDCGAEIGTYFDHSGNGAMTLATVSPMNDRQRKTLIIFGDGYGCSGTMVDSDTLLTAAHCITDGNGDDLPFSSFTVCSMENLDENTTGGHVAACFGVTDVDPAPGWSGTGDSVTDDYGLLHLNGVPGNGWMELSSASDGTITGPTDYLRGYPVLRRTCANNRITDNALTTVDTQDGREMYSADGDVQSTPVGYVKFDTSDAGGTSGAGHFYCPNAGGCGNGHYLTAVHAVADICGNPPCASGWTGGPKARDIETWVDNNM